MVNSFESEISLGSTFTDIKESFITVTVYRNKDESRQFPSPCNHPSQLKKKQGKYEAIQLSFPASKFPENFLTNGTLSKESGRLINHTNYASPTCHPSLLKNKRFFVVKS